MISAYKGKTFFDVILTTLEIIIEYISIYRLRIVVNANINNDIFSKTVLIDDTDLIFELISSYHSDERVWYVPDFILYLFFSMTFHYM